MTLGERLRKLRKQKDLKLIDVEAKTGVTRSYLSKIERGEKTNPSLDVLTALARFYNVEFVWLISDSLTEELSESLEAKNKVRRDIIELLELLDEDDVPIIAGIIKVFLKEKSGDD